MEIIMHIRHAKDRGHFQNDWLNSWHTFSFSSYYDPHFMGFNALRVINDDKIAPKKGFGFHPHQNMEIITFMLEGEIEHRDNLGNRHILTKGNAQLMRAGTGIIHSEMNNSNQLTHLLQIWIIPDKMGLKPGWWEKSFINENSVSVIAQPLTITRDITLLNSELENNGLNMAQNAYILSISKNSKLNFSDFGKSDVYIHVFSGQVNIDNILLSEGDAAFNTNIQESLNIQVEDKGKALVFIFPHE